MQDSSNFKISFPIDESSTLRHPIPQAFLIDLVGACERQLRKEKDTARVLIGWAVGQGELLEIFFGGSRPLVQHNKSVWHLTFHFMIERQYQRLMHSGMAFEQRLDLYREDVLTAAHEHVVVAPQQIIETFFITPTDVAGVVPAITDALRRFCRQVVIAEQHAGVLHCE